MATEFIVKLADRPGTLGPVLDALSAAKVNLRSIGGSKGVLGLVVSDKDTARARRAFKKAKIRTAERSLIEVRLKDTPGAAQRAAKRFAKAKVNIASLYVLAPGRGNVVTAFGVKDARAAKKALGR
jgi:hypothetical protein